MKIEQSIDTERAATVKKPISKERAMILENPLGTERAEVLEEPVTDERAELPPLPTFVLLRDQVQKLRIAEGNRAVAAQRRNDINRAEVHSRYHLRLQDLEFEITKQIQAEMREHPAWPWLAKIRGVAETSAALVVGYIDITRCDTVSALWRYAGFGVVDGRRERPTKGEKRRYNARLKTMVWRLIDLQVKLRGPYRQEYDNAKHTYTTTRPDWTKGHVEAAARRKAAKLFLSHLWLVWREAEGLPTRSPFIAEHGEGHRMIDPWEYV